MAKQRVTRFACAVVTGAGSGIGRAFALEIVRRGGRVVCADINGAAAAETVDMAQRMGRVNEAAVTPPKVHRALAVTCDVGNAESVAQLARTAEDFFASGPYPGTLNLVINNAGIGAGGRPVGDIGLSDWQRTMDVNLWGVIHGCETFTPLLRQHARELRGRDVKGTRCGIINVASTASFSAAPLMAAYNVTKAGVLALSETLSAELAGASVNVTVLCPTFVKTNIFKGELIAPASSNLAARVADLAGWSPERVVNMTLDAVDAGQLHVVPQPDARLIWMLKRLTPGAYTRGAGLLLRAADRALKWKGA